MPISRSLRYSHCILFNYRQNFDEEPIFQVENIDSCVRESTENNKVPERVEQLEISSSDFQVETKTLFDKFMAELEVHFCTRPFLILNSFLFAGKKFQHPHFTVKMVEICFDFLESDYPQRHDRYLPQTVYMLPVSFN